MSCPYRAAFCPQDTTPVPGEGRLDSNTVLVGEAPGKQEDEHKRPFIGKSGKELDQTYLPRGGMIRERVYVTNTVKCFIAASGRAPSQQLVEHCSRHHLKKELARINPKRVILMGGTACSLLGKDFDLELDHGIPRRAEILGWKGQVIPTYHPALGIHKSSAMRDLLSDFDTIRQVIEGKYHPVKDAYPNPDYRELTDPDEIAWMLEGNYDKPLATDTESKWTPQGYKLWCAQFSIEPGTGYMVRVSNKDAWNEYLYHLSMYRQVIMQNALHDWERYREAGLELDWANIRDTMQAAYHLGMPQGLKVMGWRLLGVRMQSFEDLTRPYAVDRALYYLMEAEGEDWGKPDPVEVGGTVVRNCQRCKGKGSFPISKGSRRRLPCPYCGMTGKVEIPRTYQPQGLNQKMARLVSDILRNPQTNIWERWDNWGDQTAAVEEVLGPLPRPCITLVPRKKAVRYACRDADITGRVYPILRRMAVEVRKRVRSWN